MTKEHRNALLEFARRVLAHELGAGPDPGELKLEAPVDHSGAFITLRRQVQLRGCMGTFHPGESVTATLRDAARSVIRDPRFTHQPVTADELKELAIEVSLLGPRERIHDVSRIQIGMHGILIRHKNQSGCFLPQVAAERGWSAELFLSECCRMKAKLPPDAWQDPQSEVYIFEADHFAEAP